MMREQIEEKLRAAFDPVFLEVVDESYRHNVPAGSESHFKVYTLSHDALPIWKSTRLNSSRKSVV